MNGKRKYLFLIGIVAVTLSCHQEEKKVVQKTIDQVKNAYAPDKRVALFDIHWSEGILMGETNLPEALLVLKDSLEERRITFRDEVVILPQESLGGMQAAVVTLSVANIRSQPRHAAELATQATLGTPLKVLKKEEDWYLVQTPDNYISWIDAPGIELMNQKEMDAWQASEKIVFTDQAGYIYEEAAEKFIVSDLTAGNILELLRKGSDFHQVKLPDGRQGFVKASSCMPFKDWASSRNTSAKNLVRTAKSMMGVPYLWGGTSIKGVDCSGFTKTIFFLNGKVIPRDASQQVLEGKEVDTAKNWENLEIGDLLFFGQPATENSAERVVHVGMWIGDKSFIHSRGRVRISSFDPTSEFFDEYELNRYLRTKRIVDKNYKNVYPVHEIIQAE